LILPYLKDPLLAIITIAETGATENDNDNNDDYDPYPLLAKATKTASFISHSKHSFLYILRTLIRLRITNCVGAKPEKY
jgi:hypothetical protein